MKKNFIVVGVIAALLLCILPIIYYFLISLPNHNAAILELEKQKYEREIQLQEEQKRKEKDAEDAKIAEAAKAEEEKQQNEENLDNCLSQAYSNYELNWKTSCQSQTKAAETSYANCLESFQALNDKYEGIGYTDPELECGHWKSLINYSDTCSLSSGKADSVDQAYKEGKDECYRRYGQ